MVVAWVLAFRFCCTGGQAQADVHSLNEIVSHPCHYRDENVPSSSIQNNVEAATNMAVSIQVLRRATNNFSESNVFGKGGFGIVYKGVLEDGTTIAVKRMVPEIVGEKGLKEFKSETEVLSKLRHKHLVALRGHCLEESEKLIVLEYLPQGTLSQHLFDRKDDGLKGLEWKTRLSIALDVARGVEYLHDFAQQSFIHRDLKPSNILLGDNMCAKVADFGLVRLVQEGKASIHTKLAGTFGYIAPEYAGNHILIITRLRDCE
ncbi:putative protein kinase RLK-Pelle-LRR-IX family [Medicago truncatula]|uniref:non-specific serine/threonine protein kinase n=1 Tax=Medicago truncatula TaxID=3880 RepID=A0A396HUJ3_MEDTR|nr:putative protein kinase RLK-Pelle-LRR-IX family [Medicago truncatula]